MSGIISGISTVLQMLTFISKGVCALCNTVRLGQKVWYFDYSLWTREDYIDVFSRTITTAADVGGLYCSVNYHFINKDISILEQAVVELKDPEKLQQAIELLSEAKQIRDLFQVRMANYSTAGAIGSVVIEYNSGEAILDIIQDPVILARLGIALTEQGQAFNSEALAVGGNAITLILTSAQLKENYNWFTQPALNYRLLPILLPNRQRTDQDPIFSIHICPITMHPIRKPVILNNQPFEFTFIYIWVNLHGTNPLNRQPLTLQNIQVDQQALQQIENRMRLLGIPL